MRDMPNMQEQELMSLDEARVLVHAATKNRYTKEMQSAAGREGIVNWRGLDDEGGAVKGARQLCDVLTSVKDVKKASKRTLPDVAHLPPAGTRTADFMRSVFFGKAPSANIAKVFEGFLQTTDVHGAVVNVMEVLTSPDVDVATKHTWFRAKLLPMLRFLDGRDLAEARRKAQEHLEHAEQDTNAGHEVSSEPQLPPSKQHTMTPSMDELATSKEGEPGAWFTVRKAFGGYWPEQEFDVWDEATMTWEKSAHDDGAVWNESASAEGRRVMTMTIRGNERVALPMADGFVPDATSVKANGADVKILREADGFVLASEGVSTVTISLEIGRGSVPGGRTPTGIVRSEIQFGEQGEKILADIVGLSALEKATRLRAFVKETLKYSNDSSMNAVYQSGNPREYFQRIESSTLADCDVANTYFLGLCRRAGVHGVLPVGHYVQNKDAYSSTVMSSGTAHAWSKIWDDLQQKWIRMDATPKGDPNMEEEDDEDPGKPDDGEHEGDFGEQDASDVSEEELAEMQQTIDQESKQQRERKESADPVHAFAKEAGVSVEEARTIMLAIERAKEYKDRKGRNILRRLKEEFSNIVQKNLRIVEEETLTTMSRGKRLRKPVRAMLDLRTGNLDPRGFARKTSTVEMEQVYGGFDVVLVADKSGSMMETQRDGQTKAEKQQTMMFLLAEALHTASKDFQRMKARCISPVDVRLAVVSFGNGASRIELPLGEAWGPKEQALLWRSMQKNIGGGTPDFLGLQTAQHVLGNPNEKRLRLILGSTDGESDNGGVARRVADEQRVAGTGTVVEMAGVGDGAKQVRATYGDHGTWLSNYDDLPEWAAEHVVKTARKLLPKAKR